MSVIDSIIKDYILGAPINEMSEYLNQVVPKEKKPLIKSGLSRLMWIIVILGIILGVSIMNIFTAIIRLL